MKKLSLKTYLADKLDLEELEKVNKSFDVVGDIAIIKVPPFLNSKKKIIAEAIVAANKSVKTVLNQTGSVTGDFRLRKLEHIWGEPGTETVYREYGCMFKVDLATTYFSPRLSYERIRIGKLGRSGEVVVNMFAGVGSFSIILAKYSPIKVVYSIDINPHATRLMRENVLLNRLEGKVICIRGDAEEILKEKFMGSIDRILMPLPAKASEYLTTAIEALKNEPGFIHYYDFVYASRTECPIEKLLGNIRNKLNQLKVQFSITTSRIVRTVGPRRYQIAVDIIILKKD
jgi:tRNA (guanine37-N1)-methyltransferase